MMIRAEAQKSQAERPTKELLGTGRQELVEDDGGQLTLF